LVAVGLWAALLAWPESSLRAAEGGVPDTDVHALVVPPLLPLRPLARVVDANWTRPAASAGRSVAVTVTSGDGLDDGAWQVSILDAVTGASLASTPLPGSQELRFADLPATALRAVLHRPSRSPRFGWTARTDIAPAAEGIAPAAGGSVAERIELPANPASIEVVLTAVAAADHKIPIAVRVERLLEPSYGAGLSLSIDDVFAPGHSEHLVVVRDLAPGRYRLRFLGFEPSEGSSIEVDAPTAAPRTIRGTPR
jgi:hypothetical protein